VRRPTVRRRPLFFSCEKGLRPEEVFRRNEAFERGQPMMVIAGTVIGFAAPIRGGELLGERA
jgi:hypothetical protein